MIKNYVKEYLDSGKTLIDLKNEYGIDTRISDDGKFVIFSYSQIDSPKTNDLVRMCRGLVLENNTWQIVNFPFYRFYNFEEVPTERVNFNWDKAVATTKIDGSLLNLWPAYSKWNISTRSCIGGTNAVNDLGMTFNDLFNDAIKPFTREEFFNTLNKDFCYMFELVSPFSTIVTPYTETKLYCLGARNLKAGEEISFTDVYNMQQNTWNNIILKPDIIPLCNADGTFKGFDKMKALAESVGSRDEGFVVVDYTSYIDDVKSFPRVKVKNSAYVALHHLRGQLDNGSPNFGEILSVVYKNEQAEVLAALPHLDKIIRNVEDKWNSFIDEFNTAYSDPALSKFWSMSDSARKLPENKKDFAILINTNKNFSKFGPFFFMMFNKGYKDLRGVIESFAQKQNLKDTLKGLWDKFLDK